MKCIVCVHLPWRARVVFAQIATLWIASGSLEMLKMMECVPLVLLAFKLLVFGTGMFFAIKWHRDREKEEKEKTRNNETSGR